MEIKLEIWGGVFVLCGLKAHTPNPDTSTTKISMCISKM